MTERINVDELIYERQFKQCEEELHQVIAELPREAVEKLLVYAKILKDIKPLENLKIKESYIRYLIDDGLSGETLKKTIEAIETIDASQENQHPREIWQNMLSKADKRVEKWCTYWDICADNLTEEQMMKLVSEGVRKVRSMKNGMK